MWHGQEKMVACQQFQIWDSFTLFQLENENPLEKEI